ncbi:MAG: caspase family protein, partial [Saprospiraceae bacterium]|nr:caspase family protein [Saprospiraceae bacterium]
MKHLFFLSFLLVVYSFNLPAQPKSKKEFENLFGRSREKHPEVKRESFAYDAPQQSQINIYAVVVGVSQYTAMPSLQYTDDDAMLFYAHLESPEGGAISQNHITLLLDEDATRQNIAQALHQMAQRADADDVIIFYFSGHGLSRAFLPIDFDGYYNQLSHDEVFQILQSSRARHTLCIADACHSGAFDYNTNLVTKGYGSTSLQPLFREFEKAKSGTAFLMSSSAGEASHEDRLLHQGVFTHFLLRGLRGAADYDYDGIVNIGEIFKYVAYKVPEYTN